MKRARSSSLSTKYAKRIKTGRKKVQVYRIGQSVTVVHKEFLMDVRNYRSFTPFAWEINPGLEETFPWLHQIAAGYEEYTVNGIKFSYKPTFAAVTSTSSGGLGSIVMATRYNALDGDFIDKREMENSQGAVSFRPSVRGSHSLNAKAQSNVTKKLFVRTQKSYDPTKQGDKRLWDLGKFTMAVVGMDPGVGTDNAVAIGELSVSYSITFSKPRYKNVINSDHFQLKSVTNTTPLGTATLSNQLGSTLGGTIGSDGLRYIFPPYVRRGKWLFSWGVVGGVATVTRPVISTINCQQENYFQNDTLNYGTGPQNGLTNTQNMLHNFVITVTGEGAQVIWGTAGTLPTSITAGDLWVTELSDTITG